MTFKSREDQLSNDTNPHTITLTLEEGSVPVAVWVCFARETDGQAALPPGTVMKPGEVALQLHSQFKCFPQFSDKLPHILDLMQHTYGRVAAQHLPANADDDDGANQG